MTKYSTPWEFSNFKKSMKFLSSVSIFEKLAAQKLDASQAGFRRLRQPIRQVVRLVGERTDRQRRAIQHKIFHEGKN